MGLLKSNSSLQLNIKRLRDLENLSVPQLAFYLLTLMVWMNSIILSYANIILVRLPVITLISDYIIPGVYIILIALSLPIILSRIKPVDMLIFVIPILVCIFTLLSHPYNLDVYKEYMPSFIFTVLPLYIIGVSADWKKLFPILYWISIATIVIEIIYSLFFTAPMEENISLYKGDMESAYFLLPHICLVGLYAIKKPNFLNVTVSVIGAIFMFSLGSRGPVICMLSIAIIYAMFFKQYKKPVVSRTVFLIIIILAVLFLEDIMIFLGTLAEKWGLSVRILEIYKNGEFWSSNGRDTIRETLYNAIAQKPLLGYGICGDRVITDTYAHNLPVELWTDFGIIIGSVLVIVLAVLIFLSYRKTKDNKDLLFILLALFSTGFLKLFFSGSYLNEPYTFLLIGFCVYSMRKISREEVTVENSGN